MGNEALGGEAAVLWVAATPLGHLGDASRRLGEVLGAVAHIFAEDTRRARVLIDHLGGGPRPLSLHAHNERRAGARLLAVLARGESCLLLSDAGSPAVSDPGAEVVAMAHAAGHRVSPLPGPSALSTALSVAGFPGGDEGCLFLGFPPPRGTPRRALLARVSAHRGAVVLFESPRRLAALVASLAAAEAERPLCLCRELSKVHEKVTRAAAGPLAEALAAEPPRGECTLVVGPSARPPPSPAGGDIAAALARCRAAGLSARDAARAVSAVLGAPRRQAYAAALAASPPP